jgi:hypothetical protein
VKFGCRDQRTQKLNGFSWQQSDALTGYVLRTDKLAGLKFVNRCHILDG